MTHLQDRAESFDKVPFTNEQTDSGLANHRLNNEEALKSVRSLNTSAQNDSVPESFPSANLFVAGGGEAPPEGSPRPVDDNLPERSSESPAGSAPKLTEEERRIREQIRDDNLPGSAPKFTEEERRIREQIRDENQPGAAPKLTEEERRMREQIRDENQPGAVRHRSLS